MTKSFLLLSFLMGVVVLSSNYLDQFPINYYGFNEILTYGAFSYPIAILIEIKSAKSVENRSVNIIPIKKPKYTTCLANNLPYDLFAKSVIKKAIG